MPVIEVSGRGYPVDLVYQTLAGDGEREDRGGRDLYQGIADAVRRLGRSKPLVFLNACETARVTKEKGLDRLALVGMSCQTSIGPVMWHRKIGKVGKYAPNTDKDTTILGEGQWQWLEEQLKKPAELRLVVSSTQVIPDQKGMDEWGAFPRERQRLFDLPRSSWAPRFRTPRATARRAFAT